MGDAGLDIGSMWCASDRRRVPRIVHGVGGCRCRRLRGRGPAPAITRQADAGATADAVLACGTFDGERRWRRALPAQAPLREREQRVAVLFAGY